jgi:hypothetical protein
VATPPLGTLRFIAVVVAALSAATFLVGAITPLLPRPNWLWSWEHPTRAVAAGATAAISTIGATVMAVLSWRASASRSTRIVGGGLVMLLLTVASTLVLVRSGAWLSDMRFETLPN